MATHDVALPAAVRPLFPSLCVCCGREHPGAHAVLSVTGASGGPGTGEWVVDATVGTTSTPSSNKRVTVQVPACPACAKAIEGRHLWKTILLYGGALGGAAMLGVSLMLWNSGWIGGLFLTAGVLGPVIWELYRPPAFTFTPAGARTIYEFRSLDYARAFAALNPVPAPVTPPPLPSSTQVL